MSNFNFNANEEAPDAGRMLAAAGWYPIVCTKLEHSATKDGDGEKINGQFEIVEGIYKGVNVFHNFNMRNPSEKAEKIGRAQFSALCHATRQLVIQQLTQLYSVPFRAKLKIETDTTGQYDPKNVIIAFKDYSDPAAVDVGGAVPSAGPKVVAPPTAPTAPPAQAAPIGQPWAAGAPPAAQPPVQQQPPAGMAPQPWAQPAAAPAPVQQAPVQQAPAPVQPTPEQIAAWQAAQAQANAAAAYAAQQAAMQPPAGQPAWAAAPAVDPNAVAQAAPGQLAAQPAPGPAVAQQTPPWMTPAA